MEYDEIIIAVRQELTETNKALGISNGLTDDDYSYLGVVAAALKRLSRTYGNTTMKDEDRLKAMQSLLEQYEEWESMLIADNAMWWPYVAKDRISGKSYDMMMELQAKRNELLGRNKMIQQ
jgi:hypothetical protein